METMKNTHFFNVVVLVAFIFLGACTKEKPNPRLESIQHRASEMIQKRTDLEKAIQKAKDEDPARASFLENDLELLKSRLLRLKEEAKSLNGGVELNLEPAAPSSGGH